jgi:hypothetical protein
MSAQNTHEIGERAGWKTVAATLGVFILLAIVGGLLSGQWM